uniref:Uncharacterized protein n=1 Tax=Rhizophora mucronata TaxID=61149 RepID=A0A2P2PPA5_RHIMU
MSLFLQILHDSMVATNSIIIVLSQAMSRQHIRTKNIVFS